MIDPCPTTLGGSEIHHLLCVEPTPEPLMLAMITPTTIALESTAFQPHPERSASSRPPQPRLLTDIPAAALTDAVTEVREAMTKYINFPDPTESATRRERFRLAEEASEVEETTSLMLLGAHAENLHECNQEQPHQNPSPASP
ncbi:hypothetical protein F2Q68_00029331 [Brassica cretica]|uniref:Uncharacterized protein n=1 Tax=Brassica cretica TaxID=69181 RepID=A0A8S9G6X2_BRACR|nr:hypothetical protein F2Q68_00029331 [Brassica cretica]